MTIPQREDRTVLDNSNGPGNVVGNAPAPGPGTMIRSEERLLVSTEVTESGRVLVRKYVVTEDVTVTVRLRREEVRLERRPAAGPGDQIAGPISADEFELVLHAERPVISTEVVPVERVRLITEVVSEEIAVHETLRREQIGDPGIIGQPAVPPA